MAMFKLEKQVFTFLEFHLLVHVYRYIESKVREF